MVKHELIKLLQESQAPSGAEVLMGVDYDEGIDMFEVSIDRIITNAPKNKIILAESEFEERS